MTPEMLLTRADILDGLRYIGLERGMAVEVHSSLSSLGRVQGGASTVIQALIEAVGVEGAILMSAYPVTPPLPLNEDETARGIQAKVRFLAEDDERPSGMGLVADAFRKWPGTHLGKGIHRICAWGKGADLHCQGYSHLLEVNGWVLLIGVDIHRCSCMHLAENGFNWPAELRSVFHLPEDLQRQYPPAEWYVEYHDPAQPPLADAWGKVQQEAEAQGLIRRARIGLADCMLFRAKPVVAIYAAHLCNDPLKLFDVKPGG